MQFGTFHVHDKLGLKPYKWFLKYYDLVIKPKNVGFAADEIYKQIGGKLPAKRIKAKKEKPIE